MKAMHRYVNIVMKSVHTRYCWSCLVRTPLASICMRFSKKTQSFAAESFYEMLDKKPLLGSGFKFKFKSTKLSHHVINIYSSLPFTTHDIMLLIYMLICHSYYLPFFSSLQSSSSLQCNKSFYQTYLSTLSSSGSSGNLLLHLTPSFLKTFY